MKNIDDIFKNALATHEAPYNEGAWEAMQAKMGSTPIKSSFSKVWLISASVLLLMGGFTALYFLNSSKVSKKETALNNLKVIPASKEKQVINNSNSKLSLPFTAKEIEISKLESSNNSKIKQTDLNIVTAVPSTTLAEEKIEKQQKTEPGKLAENATAFIFKPLLLKSTLCLGEEVELNNNNERSIFVEIPGKKGFMEIPANTNTTIKVSNEGSLKVYSLSSKEEQTAEIVAPINRLYIDVDKSLLYENGIPSMKFNVTGNENTVNWSTNVKAFEKEGNSVVLHPYHEKNITVTVQSEDRNGCKITSKENVTINSAYNLLAMTGFRPTSSDPDNNHFMPLALKERNTPFRMVILDPKNGALVFETTDASEGWDGINRITGEMAKEGSIWVWKVILKNPNLGEQAEYTSTITRI